MIVTNDDAVAGKIRTLRSHAITPLTWDRHRGHAHSNDVFDLGFDYRIKEKTYALGLVQLKKLDKSNKIRKDLLEIYRRKLNKV